MGKKNRNKKDKQEKFKDKNDRFNEVNEIKDKLQGLGLSPEIEGIKEFYKYCEDYIEKDIPWSGKIKLLGTKRILEAILPRRKLTKVSVNLKYDESV